MNTQLNRKAPLVGALALALAGAAHAAPASPVAPGEGRRRPDAGHRRTGRSAARRPSSPASPARSPRPDGAAGRAGRGRQQRPVPDPQRRALRCRPATWPGWPPCRSSPTCPTTAGPEVRRVHRRLQRRRRAYASSTGWTARASPSPSSTAASTLRQTDLADDRLGRHSPASSAASTSAPAAQHGRPLRPRHPRRRHHRRQRRRLHRQRSTSAPSTASPAAPAWSTSRVLDDNGQGTVSTVLAGIQWVVAQQGQVQHPGHQPVAGPPGRRELHHRPALPGRRGGLEGRHRRRLRRRQRRAAQRAPTRRAWTTRAGARPTAASSRPATTPTSSPSAP